MSDSAGERLRSARRAVAALNPELRALLHVEPAGEVERSGPLAGVPYCLKDVWDVAGLPTTHGSGASAPPAAQSGPVHLAFEAAGACFVGKSNLSDRGLTPECESWAGGVTVHPRDASRTPGGSSGGAAAAVASGMADFDWGTDFGGSIRLPAAFCGVFGLRLSARRWPLPRAAPDGRPPLVHRLNGMGPITADLRLARRVLDAAAPLRVASSKTDARPLSGLLVLGPDDFCRGEWPGFTREFMAHARAAGVPCWPAPLPPASRFDRAFVALIASHAGTLPSHRASLGAVLSALTLGPALGDRRLHPRSAEVLAKLWLLGRTRDRDAQAARAEALALSAKVDALFDAGFVLATPTSTYPAPRRGRALATRGLASFAKLGNLVDATALSMPLGTFGGGLPRGLQLLGPPGSEFDLLDLAARLD